MKLNGTQAIEIKLQAQLYNQLGNVICCLVSCMFLRIYRHVLETHVVFFKQKDSAILFEMISL